ncbi:MAG: hypothetical protein LBE92_20225 [Chryseobacterium sp.]|jgi:hypothetical protein|uniref:hypothetical protein n=1 Tax=Chryseobacterium sp. TaxID=1871047 RepID=UPI00282B7123|nr:hypothetical protein [Chryseobacterium sp.]MDR2238461.1 hypothetical protein [Chryseobacterium sp.]
MTEKFTVMESEINWPLTYFGIILVWIGILITAGVVLILSYDILDYGFTDYLYYKTGQFFTLVVAGAVILALSVLMIFYMIRGRKRDYRKVVVDEKGIYMYDSGNTIISAFLYAELCPSNEIYFPDIGGKTSYKPVFAQSLLVFKPNKSGETVMHSISLHHNYYSFKNKYELYRHFLLGIQTFRPDLKIGHRTLEEYALTPEAPEVPKFGKFEWVITVIAFAIILGLIYVFYLFIKLFSK